MVYLFVLFAVSSRNNKQSDKDNRTLHNGHCTVGHYSFQIFDNNGEGRDEERDINENRF